MKIVCVVGGSYKSFYINHFRNIQSCDLLVFNFGILYDYDMKEELLGSAVVTKELLNLSRDLHCPIVAGICVRYRDRLTRKIIVCSEDKVFLSSIRLGARVQVGNKTFVIGAKETNYSKYNKIVLSNGRINPDINKCSEKKIYIFCDRFGVNYVYKKNLVRKFHKYSKIILK